MIESASFVNHYSFSKAATKTMLRYAKIEVQSHLQNYIFGKSHNEKPCRVYAYIESETH